MKRLILSLFILCLSIPVYALSPIGEWITFSDSTHDKSGIVKVYEENNQLKGKILKVFPGKNRSPDDICKNCPDDFKDKPIQGLEFLWGFTKTGENTWGNGQVLDPKSGKIYKGTITVIDDGKKLELKGYWGIFYRTQTWIHNI